MGVEYLCTNCNTSLVSTYQHDFQSCPCGNYIDGGNVYYTRVSGESLKFVRSWDWESADGRRWKASEMSRDHIANIMNDGLILPPAIRFQAIRWGLINEG